MEVWQQISENSERGARQLVSEYGKRLSAAAARVCCNAQDAEELVYRTFDRVVRCIRQFDGRRSFFAWMHAIMLNFRRMELRRLRVPLIPVGTSSELPERVDAGRAVSRSRVGAEDVRRAVRRLSAPLQEVVHLKYYGEKSEEEIAGQLKVPTGTVKSRLHNARKELGTLLTATFCTMCLLVSALVVYSPSLRQAEKPAGGRRSALVAVTVPVPELSGWMLFGLIRECLCCSRTGCRREEENEEDGEDGRAVSRPGGVR